MGLALPHRHLRTQPRCLEVFRPYFDDYDAAVFTLGSFVPPDFPLERVEIIPPAIDPQSPKNMDLDRKTAERMLRWIGVDTDRPLVIQVSRFDPWKDQPGTIAAYRLVKDMVPDLQLALVGSMVLDDPEGWEIYRQIKAAAEQDPEIHIFTNLTGVGNVEVNAFQRLSDVCIQKSIREGFGLVVSETLWKGTPMIAREAGGISLQMQEGAGGFLVNSVEESADRILWLLENPKEGRELAEKGRQLVRERFLLTRLIADELRLYASLLDKDLKPDAQISKMGLASEPRDLVCGLQIEPDRALVAEHNGQHYHFCSQSCLKQFQDKPERLLRAAVGSPDIDPT